MVTQGNTLSDRYLVICDVCKTVIAERNQVPTDTVRCQCGHLQRVRFDEGPTTDWRKSIHTRAHVDV